MHRTQRSTSKMTICGTMFSSFAFGNRSTLGRIIACTCSGVEPDERGGRNHFPTRCALAEDSAGFGLLSGSSQWLLARARRVIRMLPHFKGCFGAAHKFRRAFYRFSLQPLHGLGSGPFAGIRATKRDIAVKFSRRTNRTFCLRLSNETETCPHRACRSCESQEAFRSRTRPNSLP